MSLWREARDDDAVYRLARRGSAWRLAGQGSRAGQGQPVSGLPSDLRYGVAFWDPRACPRPGPIHPQGAELEIPQTRPQRPGRQPDRPGHHDLGRAEHRGRGARAADYALARGINLIDTAEMYPVPPLAQTQGLTETYIGTWLASRKRRQDLCWPAGRRPGARPQASRPHPRRQDLPGPQEPHRRAGCQPEAPADGLPGPVSAALARPDHGDLRQAGYPWTEGEQTVAIEETLSVLQDFVREGKVRHVGVSNETPWGVAQFLKHAENQGLPRIVSIQNAYSPLNRVFESGLSEFSRHEDVGLLAHAPLAGHALWQVPGRRPARGRAPDALSASRATAIRRLRPPPPSTWPWRAGWACRRRIWRWPLIKPAALRDEQPDRRDHAGAAQENIDSVEVTLPQEALDGIAQIHARHPNSGALRPDAQRVTASGCTPGPSRPTGDSRRRRAGSRTRNSRAGRCTGAAT